MTDAPPNDGPPNDAPPNDAPLTPREADSALAAEYALGVLPLADRAAAEARARRDPAFAAEIAAWETHLGAMNDGFADAPPPDLMPAIEARLFPAAPPRRSGLLGWLVGALTAAALVLAVVLALPWLAPEQTMRAELAAADSALVYAVTYAGDRLTVTRTAGDAAPQGQVHELWLIAGNADPVSLGMIDGDTTTLAMPAPVAGVTLAVSLEPDGGSPTGQPTGPVLVTGVVGEV
jgi:anti-sigma-K factor RskA